MGGEVVYENDAHGDGRSPYYEGRKGFVDFLIARGYARSAKDAEVMLAVFAGVACFIGIAVWIAGSPHSRSSSKTLVPLEPISVSESNALRANR